MSRPSDSDATKATTADATAADATTADATAADATTADATTADIATADATAADTATTDATAADTATADATTADATTADATTAGATAYSSDEPRTSNDVRNSEVAGDREVREFVGSLVAIRPGKVLVFNIDSPIKRITKTIVFRNLTPDQLAFKIRTTKADGYRVKRNAGVIQGNAAEEVLVTVLPHNQQSAANDKFMILVAKTNSYIKPDSKSKIEKFWKKFSKEKLAEDVDYMEHRLRCAINDDEYLLNEEGYDWNEKAEEDRGRMKSFSDQEENEGLPMITPTSAVPTMKELMDASVRLPDMFRKARYAQDDPNWNYQAKTADDVVLHLVRTEEALKRHVTWFKGFQLFVVIAISILCVIVIILMINTPSNVSVQRHK